MVAFCCIGTVTCVESVILMDLLGSVRLRCVPETYFLCMNLT